MNHFARRPSVRLGFLHGAIATFTLMLAGTTTGWAQSADATLRGHATANSQVTAKNVATGAVRHAVTGADGIYTLVGLPPGTYRVDAGPGTEQLVTVTVASTATLDLTTGGGTAAAAEGPIEEVVVRARRLVEVKTSQVGAGVSLHQIETTPQITRNFLEFADAVPGMAFQVTSDGKTSIRSGAQNTGTTNVYIDGIGQKNYIRPSGISGQAGSGGEFGQQNNDGDPGNPFPQLAIGEYRVITSNYKAEYDQISGAAITAVTKSGTNEFHGEVFGDYTSSSLRAATPVEVLAGEGKKGGPSKEYGFAVGGPIIRDELHYFFTYEGKDFTTPNVVGAPVGLRDDNNVARDWLAGLDPSLRSNYGPVSNPFKESLYFGKLDWELSSTDNLEFTGKYRRERQQAGAAGVLAASASSTYVNDDIRYQLRWNHTDGNLYNEAMVAYEKTNDSPSKASDNAASQYVAFGTAQNGFDPLLQVNGVDPRGYFFAAQRGTSLQDDLTFSNLSWHGDHTIKMGVKFKSIKLEDRDAGTNALYSYYVNPTPVNPGDPDAGTDADPFQVTFGARGDPNISTTSSSNSKQFGVYFQDDWAVTNRLVLNLGARYDIEKTPSYTDYVTPQRFIDAINAPDTNSCAAYGTAQEQADCPFYFNGAYHGAAPGQTYRDTLRIAGINIDNYIGNGHNRKDPSTGIQPRLGFSFDLMGDQRHVIFGGAGRSYDRNVYSILEHESNKATLYVPTIHFFRAGTGCTGGTDPTCVAWDPSYLTSAGLQNLANGLQPPNYGEMHFLNNHLKTPYSDQFSVGMRNQLGQWNTSLTLARIMSYDGLIATASNFYGDGTWQWWGDPDKGYQGSYWGPNWAPLHNADGSVAGAGTLYLFENAKQTHITQVLLSLDKPYTVESHWSASIAYTYSAAYDRLEDNGDYQLDYGHANQWPTVHSPDVPKHRLVAVGSIDGPWGLSFGGKLVLETPKPFVGSDGTTTGPSDGFNYTYYQTAWYPKDRIGYKDVDLQITKSQKLPNDSEFLLRVDLLNAANWHNFAFLTDSTWPNAPIYVTDGNITGVPRTLKISLSYKW
ncbi:MAG: carboxypeptidase regulatory-like domain-containing protein [Steroidobacteraceae bacterium]